MLYALSRWWSHRKEIRRSSSIVCPRRTGRAALLLAACALVVWVLLIGLTGIAHAEDLPGRVMYVVTQDDPLNVREARSVHAPWVYRLERGEAVTVHEVNGKWAYVERCGDYGWAWAEYLSDTPPVDGLPEGWLDVEED